MLDFKFSRTVAKTLDPHSQLAQHGQQQIRHRRPVFTQHMHVAFELTISATGQK